jgi:cytidyltransferase-like protein
MIGKRVIAFGTFDPMHEGHRDFFRQAKILGEHLLVIVGRDSAIRENKGREPFYDEKARLRCVKEESDVDEALLGEEWPLVDKYGLLSKLKFDVLVLGYDQKPSDGEVLKELKKRGKSNSVEVVRLKAYKSEMYKSGKMRKKNE